MMMMLRDFFPIFKLFSFSNLFSITPKRQKPARLQKIHRQSVKHRTTATERKKSSAMETHKNSYLMLFYDLMWICVFEFIMITGMGFVYLRQSATCTFSANAFIESPERKKNSSATFLMVFSEKKIGIFPSSLSGLDGAAQKAGSFANHDGNFSPSSCAIF